MNITAIEKEHGLVLNRVLRVMEELGGVTAADRPVVLQLVREEYPSLDEQVTSFFRALVKVETPVIHLA